MHEVALYSSDFILAYFFFFCVLFIFKLRYIRIGVVGTYIIVIERAYWLRRSQHCDITSSGLFTFWTTL